MSQQDYCNQNPAYLLSAHKIIKNKKHPLKKFSALFNFSNVLNLGKVFIESKYLQDFYFKLFFFDFSWKKIENSSTGIKNYFLSCSSISIAQLSMLTIENIKTEEDVDKYSPKEVKEIYENYTEDDDDNWFAILFVDEECPHCKGYALQFDNFRQDNAYVKCYNNSCSHYGQIVDRWYKADSYYRGFIKMILPYRKERKK